MNYKTYVALVNEEEQAAGFQPFVGRPPARVEAYAGEVQERYGIAIPPDYLDLLLLADGLAHNGVVFYAMDQEEEEDQFLPGLIAENLAVQGFQTRPEYLLLGHSDLFRYAYSFPERKYFALHADTLEPAAEFSSFNDLMVNVLKHEALGLFDEDEEIQETRGDDFSDPDEEEGFVEEDDATSEPPFPEGSSSEGESKRERRDPPTGQG
ncbi:YrhA family protein [Methylacidimicrobium sp. B4]|uniref:YrhA family protein n=1 Tax=Methylacidimicrobium sp. B4 TaxID=2796139 RepID=UPI001A8E520C|nr:YrhA family protein [Methylacidimicrobium sp. B4]QSR84617.1 SMI1/KNR4 family protein [Methylacidimicrobium sp. B4]